MDAHTHTNSTVSTEWPQGPVYWRESYPRLFGWKTKLQSIYDLYKTHNYLLHWSLSPSQMVQIPEGPHLVSTVNGGYYSPLQNTTHISQSNNTQISPTKIKTPCHNDKIETYLYCTLSAHFIEGLICTWSLSCKQSIIHNTQSKSYSIQNSTVGN